MPECVSSMPHIMTDTYSNLDSIGMPNERNVRPPELPLNDSSNEDRAIHGVTSRNECSIR